MTHARSTCRSDLQLVLLSNTASRDDGGLLPSPEECAADTRRIRKSAGALLERGLVEETAVSEARLCWRTEADEIIGLFIADAGQAAIGLDDDAGAAPRVVIAGKVRHTSGAETDPAPMPGPCRQPAATRSLLSGNQQPGAASRNPSSFVPQIDGAAGTSMCSMSKLERPKRSSASASGRASSAMPR